MFFRQFLVSLCLCSMVFAQDIEKSAIRVGIAPHSSARIILESHKELQRFLEEYFKRPVEILTAKSFSDFAKKSNQGDLYDLIITSPNLAFLAYEKADYIPLMTYKKGLETIILSQSKNVLDRTKMPLRIAGQDPVSFATLCAQQWLEEQGFLEGKDLSYAYYVSASDSLGAILVRDEVDMIIMSFPNYMKLSDDIKQRVHVLYHSPAQPSRIYLAKDSKEISLDSWREALRVFSFSLDGRKHLENTKLEEFKSLDTDSFEAIGHIRDIVKKTEKRLGGDQE